MAISDGVFVLWFGLLSTVGLLGYAYRTWLRSKNTASRNQVEGWYEETVSLADEVQELADSSERAVDHDQIHRTILPLSERLKQHARTAPLEADSETVQATYSLGRECQAIGLEHTTHQAARTGVFIEDKLDHLSVVAEELKKQVPYQS